MCFHETNYCLMILNVTYLSINAENSFALTEEVFIMFTLYNSPLKNIYYPLALHAELKKGQNKRAEIPFIHLGLWLFEFING